LHQLEVPSLARFTTLFEVQMLSQKLAAFLALIVFASQGAMAAPVPLHPRSSDDFLETTGSALGELLAPIVPAEFGKSAIQAAKGDVVFGDGHPDGATDEAFKASGSVFGSVVAAVLPDLAHGGIEGGEHYYDSRS